MKETKNDKKVIIIATTTLLVFIVVAVFVYGGYIHKTTEQWDNKIYSGVMVENQDLSGKSKEEAIGILRQKYGEEILKKQLSVKASDKTYKMDYSKLNGRYNLEEAANEALEYGKDRNVFSKYKAIKGFSKKVINLKFSYDPEYIKDFVAEIAKGTNSDAVNAKLKVVSSDKFEIEESKPGYKLNEEDLINLITSSINGKINEENTIEAKIEEVAPKVTEDKLKQISGRIATFSTNYGSSSPERAYNVELATRAINGTLLMPGDTFSYNEVVGERTREKGYKDAPVIVGNKVEAGLAGGICQVSSTLYQAVLKTGLKSVERYNHSLPTSYVPIGLDATVVYGSLDYKFKNTFDFPIYIEGITQNRILYFNIYGNTSVNSRRYEITTDVYETIEPKVENIEDAELPEGQTVVDQKPLNGFKVKVYRKVYENDTLVDTEFLSNDVYQPVPGKIKVGIKKAPEVPKPETPTEQPVQPEQPAQSTSSTPPTQQTPKQP